MGIYIPNMDTPRKCIRCPFCLWGKCLINENHDVSKAVNDAVKDEHCPIIKKEE